MFWTWLRYQVDARLRANTNRLSALDPLSRPLDGCDLESGLISIVTNDLRNNKPFIERRVRVGLSEIYRFGLVEVAVCDFPIQT